MGLGYPYLVDKYPGVPPWEWIGVSPLGLDEVLPVGTGWGYPPPGLDWMGVLLPHPPCQETEQQSEHLLRSRQYASCVHARGLSCFRSFGTEFHSLAPVLKIPFVVKTRRSSCVNARGTPGGPYSKIFFSSLNMYQAKSGVKNFSLYWKVGGGPCAEIFFFLSEHVSSQIWCQNFFPLLGGGGPSVENFFSSLNIYQAKSGVKNISLY